MGAPMPKAEKTRSTANELAKLSRRIVHLRNRQPDAFSLLVEAGTSQPQARRPDVWSLGDVTISKADRCPNGAPQGPSGNGRPARAQRNCSVQGFRPPTMICRSSESRYGS